MYACDFLSVSNFKIRGLMYWKFQKFGIKSAVESRHFKNKQRMRWHHSLPLPLSITCVALGLNADHQSCRTPRYFEQREKAAAIVKQFMVRNGVPGLSIGVSRNGRCVWEQGFGYADVEQLVPCKRDTVMRIASISKPVTAALAACLVQSGRLDLDASVQDYVPDFPKKKYNDKDVTITIRQLLSHTSGIRHYKMVTFSFLPVSLILPKRNIYYYQPVEPTIEDFVRELKKAAETGIDGNVKNLLHKINIKYKNKRNGFAWLTSSDMSYLHLIFQEKYGKSNSTRYRSVELKDKSEFFSNVHYECVKDALEIFKHDELVAEPGSKVQYTTHGFTLLSAALEKAANKSYIEQITNFFRELGMNHSYLDLNFPLITNRARYYYRDPDHKLRNIPEVDNSSKWAGGGLLSTVTDLLIFANAMLYSYHAAQQSSIENNEMKPLINAETMKIFWKGEISDHLGNMYALGWCKIDGEDKKYGGLSDTWPRKGVFLHTGAAVGASSVLLIKPDHNFTGIDGTCVAILTNLHECGELTQLAMEIVEIFGSPTFTETS
uniref:Beta-lactamase domain-containing protein n=1 Tax=Elaeophora elaphi TaxID=1147741 RepID=A0A0R3S3C2_9BILA